MCCKAKTQVQEVPPEVESEPVDLDDPLNKQLEKLHKVIESSNSTSFTKMFLTAGLVQKYKNVRTDKNCGLAMCIVHNAMDTSMQFPHAVDSLCYDTYNDFFDPVIKKFQLEKSKNLVNCSDELDLSNLDTSKIISFQLIASRNIKGQPFASCATEDELIAIENRIKRLFPDAKATVGFKDYQDYEKSSMSDIQNINNLLAGRGILRLDDTNEKLICINKRDHIKIVVQNMGSFPITPQCIGDSLSALSAIDATLQKLMYATHPKYNLLTFSPEDIGSGFHIKIEGIFSRMRNLPNFNELIDDNGLKVLTIPNHENYYILTNKQTLDLTMNKIVNQTVMAFVMLADFESRMALVNTNSDIMPTEPLYYLLRQIRNSSTLTYTRKYLTDVVAKKYANVKCGKGSSLAHCIRINAYCNEAILPRAAEPLCYTTYPLFFDPIIKEYHNVKKIQQPRSYFDLSSCEGVFEQLKSTAGFAKIKSFRVRIVRNFAAYPFQPTMTCAQRVEIENILKVRFKDLDCGQYYSLDMVKNEAFVSYLDEKGLMPKHWNARSFNAGVYRDYPKARGLWLLKQDDVDLAVQVNGEDHIKIVASHSSVDNTEWPNIFFKAFRILYLLIPDQKELAQDKAYGYLTFCPSSLGTGMRLSVKIQLKNLGPQIVDCSELFYNLALQIRGSNGEHTNAKLNVFEVCNRVCFGQTESEIFHGFVRGLIGLLGAENG